LTDPQLRLIQIDDSLSRTAARAWQWVPVRAGTEEALASGLACVLLEERLVSARGPIPSLTVAAAALQTGLTQDEIRDLARTIVSQTPVVAIARDDHPAVAALNIMLGTVGAQGGIVRRSRDSGKYVSADGAFPSASAVLIDASVPWDFVPQTDAEVFRFAAWDGGSSKADWLLPAPAFLKESTDVPSAPTSAIETYALAAKLVKPFHPVQSALQFLSSFDPSLSTTDKVIHARCEELFRKRTGTVIGQETMALANFASAQKFEEQLWKGAVWAGEAPHPEKLRCELKEWPAPVAAATSETWLSQWRAPVLPSLATKLYRESNLRERPEEKRS
jgi:hypothetical protein